MPPYPQADYATAVLPLEGHAPRPRWQEWFSWAFVQAVASAAGLVAEIRAIDANQIDVQVQTWHTYEGRVRTIGLQLKSTYAPEFVEEGSYVVHDFPAEHYNRLLAPADVRRFLVIVAVPPPDDSLMALDSDVAYLQAAGWWGSIDGEPTDNQYKRVRVPTKQRFDVDGLRRMLLWP